MRSLQKQNEDKRRKVNKLEDQSIEITQSEEQREKISQNNFFLKKLQPRKSVELY